MKKVIPCLWYNNQAEEAVNLYTSLFPNSRIGKILRYDAASAEASGQPEGSVLTIEFTINEHDFLAMNGGPLFKFTEATSFIIECENQEEVDKYWNALTADGGEESMCGWLKDKFGVSWQITPIQLMKYITDPNPKIAQAAMNAMLKMRKIIIADIEAAVNNA